MLWKPFFKDVERALGVKIIMVSIDECLDEDTGCKGSCTSNLKVNFIFT